VRKQASAPIIAPFIQRMAALVYRPDENLSIVDNAKAAMAVATGKFMDAYPGVERAQVRVVGGMTEFVDTLQGIGCPAERLTTYIEEWARTPFAFGVVVRERKETEVGRADA